MYIPIIPTVGSFDVEAMLVLCLINCLFNTDNLTDALWRHKIEENLIKLYWHEVKLLQNFKFHAERKAVSRRIKNTTWCTRARTRVHYDGYLLTGNEYIYCVHGIIIKWCNHHIPIPFPVEALNRPKFFNLSPVSQLLGATLKLIILET